MSAFKQFFSLLNRHKLKLVVLSLSTTIFLLLLFPFNDLSDLVTTQVAKMTNNQVYVQFDDMRLSVLPTPGVALDNVYVETPTLSGLKAQEVVATPSIRALIFQKPAGQLTAKGFLNGEVEVYLAPGKASDNGVPRNQIELEAKQLSLEQVKNLLQLPVTFRGNLDIESSALVDLSFQEQPDMDVVLKVDKFELPVANVQTPLGPVTLPDLKLSAIEMKGRLSSGKLLIEQGSLGRAGDELVGSIKGSLDLRIQNMGGRMYPVVGGYNLDIDLTVKKSFQDRATLFLTFIDGFKSQQADGAKYSFKVSASNLMMPPSLSPKR